MRNKKVLIIGTGKMALEYAKVLRSLQVDFDCLSRSGNSLVPIDMYKQLYIGNVLMNGKQIEQEKYDAAIVAVTVDYLAEVVFDLLDIGITEILVEKPGAVSESDFKRINLKIKDTKANVKIAYNRRFYQSVIEAKKLIEEDGGVQSANFDFSELAYAVESSSHTELTKNNWFLANSTHLIDLAFYLIGKPSYLNVKNSGDLQWHTKSIFVGCGITQNNVLFSFYSNWQSPGRWGIELNTPKRKLIFKPLEQLKQMKIGSFNIEDIKIESTLDVEFKPGLYLQVEHFLNATESINFKSWQEQFEDFKLIYRTILQKV